MWETTLVVLLLISFFFLAAWKATISYGCDENAKKLLKAVPSPSTYDVKLGNLPDLAKAGSLHEYLYQLHSQYGPIAGFRYFDKFVLSLASPELFKQTNKLFNRPVPLFSLFKPLIGEASIQYANDEDGQNRRKLLDPFFAHSSVKKIFPVFIEATDKCRAKWDSQLQHQSNILINLKEDMFLIATYAIGLSAFGNELSEVDIKTIVESYNHCWDEMDKSIKGDPLESGTPREAIFLQKRDAMYNLVQRMIDDYKPAELGAETVNRGVGGFLEFMLQNKSFSNEQIRCDTLTFLIGGFHTTANFLVWIMYFLAKFPNHQQRVRQEINEVQDGGDPSFDSVTGMPFTTAVLNETLRFIAIAPFAGRYSNEEEVIGDLTIPKETMMVQALGVVLQSEKYWDSPCDFVPERFLSTGVTSDWSFKPFGVGNRMCPASKYAMLETKAVISSLIQHYSFELVDQKVPTAEYNLVGAMKDEMQLRVTPL